MMDAFPISSLGDVRLWGKRLLPGRALSRRVVLEKQAYGQRYFAPLHHGIPAGTLPVRFQPGTDYLPARQTRHSRIRS